MENSLDRLYKLLPYVYQQRDAALGYPFRALLRVIAEQVNIVEEDIAQLYENFFIETSEDWVVPYIGDLVGYRLVHEAGEPGDVATAAARERNKILIPRREVANTIRYRRRKGSLALLELLANNTAGWPARVVEFFRWLGWTQSLNHMHLDRGRWVDLRQGDALARINTPFDELAHTVEVRRPNSQHGLGRYNLPSIGLFVWRLKAYPVTQTTACYIQEAGHNSYTFSALGNDSPLYTRPEPEAAITAVAGEMNLPVPIRRRAMEERLTDYYGEGKSLQIWEASRDDGFRRPISPESIIVADLTDWKYRPQDKEKLAVDPVLGRIAYRAKRPFYKRLWVSYYTGFSSEVGGGEYSRVIPQPTPKTGEAKRYRVVKTEKKEGEFGSLPEALKQWEDDRPTTAVIEIAQSGIYKIETEIKLEVGQVLQLQAANRTRPIIRFADTDVGRSEYLAVQGKEGSRFVLDGIIIMGRGMLVQDALDELIIRHCTLVPGWSLHPNCKPRSPGESSLELIDTNARVTIERSILGFIQVTQNEVKTDPIPIHISDSILDATEPDAEIIGAPDWPLAHATMTIQRCTVIGSVQTHAIEMAENSIFTGAVKVGRTQIGCMRFCYIPPGSRTPRRYCCQPDLVERSVDEQEKASEQVRVQPQFNRTQYGTPTYCQLADTCAIEIKRGADDESEMGVFHHLYQPQRAANLKARLEEYTPAGMDVGIFYVS
ncbi:MAG: hypothetical protein KC415_05800 [Anaerolineales bacterium]|nr:hypothetical protein [Anaerolineales bacterium]